MEILRIEDAYPAAPPELPPLPPLVPALVPDAPPLLPDPAAFLPAAAPFSADAPGLFVAFGLSVDLPGIAMIESILIY
jgi:hypothetical protein